MRLLLLMAAVLVTALRAEEIHRIYTLPQGFPDGTLVTIFFPHDGGSDIWVWGPFGPVKFDFCNEKPVVRGSELTLPANVPAHLRVEIGNGKTVYSNTKIDNKYQTEVVKSQSFDVSPPAKGWWRVDVIKLDKLRLNVFFQGFWSEVRNFNLPLNKINTLVIRTESIEEPNKIEVYFRYPNKDLIPPTFDQFMQIMTKDEFFPRTITTLPGFPLNGKLELSVVMRATGGVKPPAFRFAPAGIITRYFLGLKQEWRDGTHKIILETAHAYHNGGHPTSTQCTFDWSKPNGELVHLVLERIRYNIVEVRVLYKNIEINKNWINDEARCWLWIPDERVKSMDTEFDIVASEHAVFLHINRSYPDTFPPSNSTFVPFTTEMGFACGDGTCRCCVRYGDPRLFLTNANCVDGYCPR